MSRLDRNERLLQQQKMVDDYDDDHIYQDVKSIPVERQDQDEDLKVPSLRELTIPQIVIIVLLYLILAFLVGFMIYISSTWNKDRTNEYTWGH